MWANFILKHKNDDLYHIIYQIKKKFVSIIIYQIHPIVHMHIVINTVHVSVQVLKSLFKSNVPFNLAFYSA